MAFYKIVSHSGGGFPLNVATSSVISGRTNVNIWSDTGSQDQRWQINSLTSNQKVKTLNNLRYMLNANTSTWNCDVYTYNSDACVNFVNVSTDVYRIQLHSDTSKYLTVDQSTSGTNVKWAALNTASNGQKWKITKVTLSSITVGGWLKMYLNPTSNKTGRTVSMPSLSTYTGPDGVKYQFTNKNYWYSYENPYSSKINPQAVTRIKALTGMDPVINTSGACYTDENGNYWMAVGPNVVNPNHTSTQSITPQEMYGLGKLDVVVKDEYNNRYYIPAVVGDAKAHTWSNGIVQTFKSYPNGAYTSAGSNYNGMVCAEFIGPLANKLSTLKEFSIDKIIFYPN